MRVDELDSIAFSYIKMGINRLYEYIESPINLIKGDLNIVKCSAIDILKPKINDDIIILQQHSPTSDIAYIYQYNDEWCMFISNLQDGWVSLVHMISKNNHIKSYSFNMDKEKNRSECRNVFVFRNGITNDERVVQSMVDSGRWIFYEKGPYQWFENPEYYKNRMKKKRMNYTILQEYCKKLGIDLGSDSFFYPKVEAVVFERKHIF